VKVALVGCGDIARRYATSIAASGRLELAGATDLVPARAETLVGELGGSLYPSLEALLDDDAVDVVVNLTAPQAHATVTAAALEAGKHVHSEKPIALRYDEARALVELAADRGLCLSCSPATLLGEAQQTAWKLVREGAIGTVRAAYAEANWGLIERWHPTPEALLAVGPVVDVGVYSLTVLTGIFGPARRVLAYGTVLAPERSRLDGVAFRQETPDFVVAAVELEAGPVVRLTASFWVEHRSYQRGLELHGDGGSLFLASWAEFDSPLELAVVGGDGYRPVQLVKEPFRGIEWSRPIVELADAVAERRPHRLSGAHAAHVVEILGAVDESVRSGGPVDIASSFEPPAPMRWAT
jgi:predicted dehydrogenase